MHDIDTIYRPKAKDVYQPNSYMERIQILEAKVDELQKEKEQHILLEQNFETFKTKASKAIKRLLARP